MTELFSQMKASDVVSFIKDQVVNKEEILKTKVLPYDLKQAVSNYLLCYYYVNISN